MINILQINIALAYGFRINLFVRQICMHMANSLEDNTPPCLNTFKMLTIQE